MFNVCFVGGFVFFPIYMFLFLVTFRFLSYHLFRIGLLTRFIICLIFFLTSFHVVTAFPWDSVGKYITDAAKSNLEMLFV